MNLKDLLTPFPAGDIEWRCGATTKDKKKGIALAYITNRAIMERLDDVCGQENWRNEFREWHGTSQLCGLSIKVGDEWITKWDGADNSDRDATKGGLSDAMKRAGYQWGIGRYLYHLPNEWVQLKNERYLASTPQLPAWALPGGGGKPGKEAPTQTRQPAPMQATALAPNKASGIRRRRASRRWAPTPSADRLGGIEPAETRWRRRARARRRRPTHRSHPSTGSRGRSGRTKTAPAEPKSRHGTSAPATDAQRRRHPQKPHRHPGAERLGEGSRAWFSPHPKNRSRWSPGSSPRR